MYNVLLYNWRYTINILKGAVPFKVKFRHYLLNVMQSSVLFLIHKTLMELQSKTAFSISSKTIEVYTDQ